MKTLSRQAVAEQRPLLELAQQAVAASASLVAAVDGAALRGAFDVDAAARQANAAVETQWADLRDRAAAFDADPL